MSIYDFLFGGLSGMIASAVIQPIDTVKVRIQLIGEAAQKGSSTSPLVIARSIFAKEGARGFYKGLDSALFRQATYCTARLGIYKTIFNKIEAENGRVTFTQKAAISLVAGFLGSLVGNPSDLVLVRFQSDSFLPTDQRRNYKNVFEAFARIIKEEGIMTLWRGSTPTVLRAMSMNLGMLTTYDEIKERLNKSSGTKDTFKTQIVAGVFSAIVCSFLSLPFDNAKTKLQKMMPDSEGKFPYKGIVDCFKKSIKREGVTGLWVGYPTFFSRVAPHSIIVLLTQDYLHKIFNPKKSK
jgi:solute carrier family 25 oxoglutarate transporter 11